MATSDITQVADSHIVDLNVKIGTIEGPSSYAAGGFAAQAVAAAGAGFGLSTVSFVIFEPVILDATHVLIAKYNYATGKILVYESADVNAGPVEVTDADDLDSVEFRFCAMGKL